MTTAACVPTTTLPATATVEAIVELEIAMLTDLHAVLQREETALSQLDYAAIDDITDHKERIEGSLLELRGARQSAAGTLAAGQRDRYRGAVDQVRRLGERNNRRLSVCVATVREMLNALTGANAPSYGRPAATPPSSRPVLTSTLG